MTTQTSETTQVQPKELEARNKKVERAYNKIIQGAKSLLLPFTNVKYRTIIEINHSESSKETNLMKEFICSFFNITLTKNRADYNMIYFTYEDSAIEKFGARLYNRALRELFKNTMQEKNKPNITDCVRVNNPGQIEGFFVNRLRGGANSYISISVLDKE
jgi:hypothetical protein